MPKTTFYLVRHGQSEANTMRVYSRTEDEPLTQEGKNQAALVADYFKDMKIDALYSSTFKRAHDTARIIGEKNNLGEPQTDARIREFDTGDLAGKSYEEVQRKYPDQLDDGGKFPLDYSMAGGESLTTVRTRAYDFFLDAYKKHPGESVLVVLHGGVMRILHNDFTKLVNDFRCVETTKKTANCDVWVWDFDEEEEKIIKFYESGDND